MLKQKQFFFCAIFALIGFLSTPSYAIVSSRTTSITVEQPEKTQTAKTDLFSQSNIFKVLDILGTPTPKDQVNESGIDKKAIAGFVCGLVSLFVAGIILGILAIVFSAIALTRIKGEKGRGKGMAVAGLVLGIVGVVGAALFLATK